MHTCMNVFIRMYRVTGRRIGLVLQTIVNIIASIVVGMYFAWKLTLILMLSAPIIAPWWLY